jgi:MoaA/NifB/PqqE/SkfB family radical SAM enzyme
MLVAESAAMYSPAAYAGMLTNLLKAARSLMPAIKPGAPLPSIGPEMTLRQTAETRQDPATALWRMHPRGEYFLTRGGDTIGPPVCASIGLTNKCNLRCEICGSQKTLDGMPGYRRHMEFATFKAVAETLFPFLVSVELNSQGDPLLYPQIDEVLDAIRRHDCDVKVQTNGTLFTSKNIALLASMFGEVNISLDAVGAKFDEVRQGGVWAKAEPGILSLLRERDPARLAVGLYPTVTRRTIGEVLPIVEWAARHDVDLVAFHRYVPIAFGITIERCPTDEELGDARDVLRRWLQDTGDALTVVFDGEHLNSTPRPARRYLHASAAKQQYRTSSPHYHAPSYPTESGTESSDPDHVCTAPNSYVEIGLEGQISACCRSQEIALGYATSVERFADTWFGDNYARVRSSLKRTADGELPLPCCEGCMACYAPKALKGRTAMSYEGTLSDRADGLRLVTEGDIVIDRIGHMRNDIFWGTALPPGIRPSEFVLVERNIEFARAHSLEAVRPGHFFLMGRKVYFSTPDGSDPRRKARIYSLKRVKGSASG